MARSWIRYLPWEKTTRDTTSNNCSSDLKEHLALWLESQYFVLKDQIPRALLSWVCSRVMCFYQVLCVWLIVVVFMSSNFRLQQFSRSSSNVSSSESWSGRDPLGLRVSRHSLDDVCNPQPQTIQPCQWVSLLRPHRDFWFERIIRWGETQLVLGESDGEEHCVGWHHRNWTVENKRELWSIACVKTIHSCASALFFVGFVGTARANGGSAITRWLQLQVRRVIAAWKVLLSRRSHARTTAVESNYCVWLRPCGRW